MGYCRCPLSLSVIIVVNCFIVGHCTVVVSVVLSCVGDVFVFAIMRVFLFLRCVQFFCLVKLLCCVGVVAEHISHVLHAWYVPRLEVVVEHPGHILHA